MGEKTSNGFLTQMSEKSFNGPIFKNKQNNCKMDYKYFPYLKKLIVIFY